jgi:hypothetical protein
MARNKTKSPSKEVTAAPSMAGSMPEMMNQTAEQKKRDAQYQLDDDKRILKSYVSLRQDKPRHSRAMASAKQDSDDIAELDDGKADAMPRKAKRISARKAGRPRGR